MKSLTAVCQTGASMPAINPNGRTISRHQHPQRENAEMKMYLSKLKDLVPFMPKNRKLSKLEIIQHVIDYICDLQSELETHPEIGNFDAASALNFATSQNIPMDGGDDDDDNADEAADADDEAQEDGNANNADALSQRLAAEAQQQQHFNNQQTQQQQQQHQTQFSTSPAVQQRQPLVDRQAPNTILPVSTSSTSAAATSYAGVQQQQQQQLHHFQQQQLQQQVALQNSQTTSAEKDSNSRQTSC